MRKSPSVTSSTSVEAFVPRRRKLSKDKDCLSMHSEKMTNIYRRFSLANGRSCCKVGQSSIVRATGVTIPVVPSQRQYSVTIANSVITVVDKYTQGVALTGRNTTGPPFSRVAIIRQKAA